MNEAGGGGGVVVMYVCTCALFEVDMVGALELAPAIPRFPLGRH